MNASLRSCVLAAAVLLAAACTTTEPVVDTSARSHDGLFPVRNTGDARVWARADLDLERYARLLPEAGGVRYASNARGRFAITAEDRARLERLAAKAFEEALADVSGFTPASAPGPDVLLVRGTLIDVSSSTPPADGGRRAVFLQELGEATLVVELVDSETGAVLLRSVETRRARTDGLRRSVPARNWLELERTFDAWGDDLRAALERLRARFTIEAPASGEGASLRQGNPT